METTTPTLDGDPKVVDLTARRAFKPPPPPSYLQDPPRPTISDPEPQNLATDSEIFMTDTTARPSRKYVPSLQNLSERAADNLSRFGEAASQLQSTHYKVGNLLMNIQRDMNDTTQKRLMKNWNTGEGTLMDLQHATLSSVSAQQVAIAARMLDEDLTQLASAVNDLMSSLRDLLARTDTPSK